MIDTHIHLDDEKFVEDADEVVARARAAGIGRMLVPAISLPSVRTVLDVCKRFPGYAFPMVGLHPEEVRADYREALAEMKAMVTEENAFVAVGEVGLDYYWSREFEREQLEAFAQQIEWSIEFRLPLMIHLRKAQNEAVRLLRGYRKELRCGGVFHCFTGNAHEAAELLEFEGFALGIGGVLTFKKATLPDTLREAVPLERIVLETDAPYMAPVPMRGRRNESAFIPHIVKKLAETYGVGEEMVDEVTSRTARRIFG